jgi:hypothetical protein
LTREFTRPRLTGLSREARETSRILGDPTASFENIIKRAFRGVIPANVVPADAEIERAAIETQTTPAISLGFLRGYRKHVFWPDFTIIRMSRLSTILRSFGPMKGKQEDIDCDG